MGLVPLFHVLKCVYATLSCWQDFAHYKSGVYKHLYGDPMGGHAVKLIGWGTTDDGVDYWVCRCSMVTVLCLLSIHVVIPIFVA